MTRRISQRHARGLYGVACFAALTVWTAFVNPAAFGVPGGGNTTTTFTTSTTSHTALGCPTPPFAPDCILEGMTLSCATTSTTFGPTCIGTGNLDVPNQLPCTSCNCVSACPVPPFGMPFCVAAGTLNINTNTDTTTFICKSAAPALAPWALALCAALLAVYAVWRVRHRRGAAAHPDR